MYISVQIFNIIKKNYLIFPFLLYKFLKFHLKKMIWIGDKTYYYYLFIHVYTYNTVHSTKTKYQEL